MVHQLLADNITQFRKAAGLTQTQLAKKLNVSNRAVSKWENGISLPTLEHCFRLAGIFHISVHELLGKQEPTPPPKNTAKGMESIEELYRIGRGPSSSHTMGPEKACRLFREENKDADKFSVSLFGSLARTGAGHQTDVIIKKTFAPLLVDVQFDYMKADLPHPNTMTLTAFKQGIPLKSWEVYSVGGGAIKIKGQSLATPKIVYPLKSFQEIASYCEKNRLSLWQYVNEVEGDSLFPFLQSVWSAMKNSIEEGLLATGTLPGGLKVQRKARYLMEQRHMDETTETKENRVVCAYAYAVSEQNASGGAIVTAPTCGAAGVLPAVLYYMQQKKGYSDEKILKALATAGLIGNLIKTNASISGAQCGCQAEIGSACSMAAAALGELFDMSIPQIEYAAEVAIEHHLGLTCDPILGLVQIPCIERNAVAAMRAINAVNLANFLSDTRKISFDLVIKTMYETGLDLSKNYRETSGGGLAKLYR